MLKSAGTGDGDGAAEARNAGLRREAETLGEPVPLRCLFAVRCPHALPQRRGLLRLCDIKVLG